MFNLNNLIFMKKTLLLIFTIWCYAIYAQGTNVISGKVVNDKSESLPGAIISQLSLPDSSLVQQTTTDANGVFSIDIRNQTPETILLETSYIGYGKVYSTVTDRNILIVMDSNINKLKEVKVTAHKSILKRTPGQFMYIPRGMALETANLYELLSYTPLISVEGDVVSIIGKGNSTIYINGRKLVMNKELVMDMLRSTQPDRIERIEIITTPGSAYSASTSGGIINIVLKNMNNGIRGSVNIIGNYTNERFSPRSSVSLSFAKGSFNASTTLGFRNTNSYIHNINFYNYKTTQTTIENDAVTKNKYTSIYGIFNTSYRLNKRNIIGASLSIQGGQGEYESIITGDYTDPILHKKTQAISFTDKSFKRPAIGAAVFYTLTTDNRGSNLDISMSYSKHYSESLQDMEYSILGNSMYEPYKEYEQNTTGDNFGYQMKVRYAKKYTTESKLEFGVQFNKSRISNGLVQEFNLTAPLEPLFDNSNHFIYSEATGAGYITYDCTWNSVISSKLGLRGEYTEIDGKQRATGDVFGKNDFYLIPQLSFTFDIEKNKHALSLDLSRFIVRPYYNTLNPFKVWTSENTYSVGNPYQSTLVSNNIDLSYTLLNKYIFSVYYSYDTGLNDEYSFPDEENITVSSWTKDSGKSHSLTLCFNTNHSLIKNIWDISGDMNIYYISRSGFQHKEIDLDFNNWDYTVTLTNTFRIPALKGHVFRLKGYYSSPTKTLTDKRKGRVILTASLISKFKWNGSLSLNIMKQFNSSFYKSYNSDIYSFKQKMFNNNLFLSLTYNQTFGKNKVRGAKNAYSSDLDNRTEN